MLLKQLELSYLPKFKQSPGTFNVSRLSQETQISRATVMNYIKCFKDARLINMLYRENESYPQKPAMLYLHNPNLIYSNRSLQADRQAVCETFFYNTVHSCHSLNLGSNSVRFVVDGLHSFRIITQRSKVRMSGDMYYVIDNMSTGANKNIPLWLFGFLY